MKTLTEKAEAIADEFFKTIPNQSVYTTTSLIEFVYKKAIADAAGVVLKESGGSLGVFRSEREKQWVVDKIKKLGEA